MKGLGGRMSVLLVTLAVLVTGLDGAYGYWESYFQHRGFTPVRLIAGAHPGHRIWVHFYSEALHRNYDYLVYLPPGYDPIHHRYPVYYLLHGSPGRPQVYTGIASMGTRMDNLIHRGRMQPMILVFPDGRIGGSTYSDSEWANTHAGRYESYVIDVVNDVDQRFATVAQRSARVIAGFSAGAYGAINIAVHNPTVFGNIQSWSGYYRQTRTGVFAHATPAQLAFNSPNEYVPRMSRRLRLTPLRAFLFIGRDDNSSPTEQPMAAALARAGARASYALYKGGHDWQLWHAHINQLLILAAHDAAAPLRAGRGSARTLTPRVKPLPHGIGRHHLPNLVLPSIPDRPLSRPGNPPRRHDRQLELVAFHVRQRRPDSVGLGVALGGLLLSLVSAAVINLGFLFQHRGLGRRPEAGLLATLRGAFRSPVWLGGQVLGWFGFGGQILAVAIAPLALVQAFAAGGLALSVPLAARFFGHRITRRQRGSVLLMAAGLAALPIGYGAAHDGLEPHTLGLVLGVIAVLAAGMAGLRVRGARAVAAGAFYGAADAAIKAVSVDLSAHGVSALISVWTAAAAVGTFAGFLCFQSALAQDSAIGAISLMNGFAALVAVVCGLIAFGESLGADTVAVIAHVIAIAIVLGCVPQLAAAQAEMAEGAGAGTERSPAPPPRAAEYGSSG
jgi:enterochelin esterase-like enzyme/drug/metabolite transporter (DMT)-like permease